LALRKVLSNIDVDVLRPNLELTYLWNLKYLSGPQWEAIKGDCRVSPVGPLMLMSREITDMRLKEIMEFSANNENVMRIIGEKGLASLLRYVYERQKLPVGDIVPSQEELERKAQAEAAQMMRRALPAPEQAIPGQGAPTPESPSMEPPYPPAQQPIPDAALMGAGGGYGDA
jgi:hypothetical protein